MNFLNKMHNILSESKNAINLENSLHQIASMLLEGFESHTISFFLWDKLANCHICQFIFGENKIDLTSRELIELKINEITGENGSSITHYKYNEISSKIRPLECFKEKGKPINEVSFLPLQYNHLPVGLVILLNENNFVQKITDNELEILSFYCSSILSTSQLRNESMQKSAKLATLYEMSKNTDSILTPSDLLGSLTEAVKALVKFDTCLLFINDRKSDKPVIRRIKGDTENVKDILNNPKNSIIGKVMKTTTPILSHHGNLKSCLCVPINFENEILGVLFVGTLETYEYDMSDVISISILASHFAAIDSTMTSLLQMRNYSKAALDGMKAGLIAFDNKGIITHINLAGRNFIYAPAECEGKHYGEIINSDNPISKIINNSVNHGHMSEHMEIEGMNDDQIIDVTTYHFKDNEGIRLGTALLIWDVTEIKEKEKKYRRSERLSALGEMTASIAHEIRNPLTGIKMVAQLLEDELVNFNPKLLEHTQLQIQEVERLDRIISDMLLFARPSIPVIKECDINEIINSLLFIMDTEINKKKIHLVKEFEENALFKCDDSQIRQVLLNIILNSIEAIPVNGEITIMTKTEADRNIITVRDNGDGIPDNLIGKIFNPFFTTKETGTGLGLAIAHRIMEEHRGQIEFNSMRERGAEVQIILPVNP